MFFVGHHVFHYWLSVARYKKSHDAARLKEGWQKLIQAYPTSEWAKKASVIAKR